MSELATRVAVAALAIPVVLGLVYLGGWFFAAPLALFAALGALELYRMAAAGKARPLAPLGAVVAAGLVAIATWATTFDAFAPWALVTLAGLATTTVFAAVALRGPEEGPLGAVAVTLFGAVYTGLSLATVPLLRALPEARGWSASDGWGGLAVIALPLAATWIGDSAAFFAGSAWGRSKLAPTISPNKSWVGFWAELVGAGVTGAVWLVAAGPALPGAPLGLPFAAGIGVVLGAGAVVGDLVESLFKRDAGVKDSGTFFPGHGGVLDRIDSLIVTLPLAYIALALLGGGG